MKRIRIGVDNFKEFIELKSIKDSEDLDQAAEKALKQIEEKAYNTLLKEANIADNDIRKLAIIVKASMSKWLQPVKSIQSRLFLNTSVNSG